jgi:hypothetical protein
LNPRSKPPMCVSISTPSVMYSSDPASARTTATPRQQNVTDALQVHVIHNYTTVCVCVGDFVCVCGHTGQYWYARTFLWL